MARSKEHCNGHNIIAEKAMVPADFGIEVSKYNKRDDGEIVGLVHYTSEEEGVRVDLFNGFVQTSSSRHVRPMRRSGVNKASTHAILPLPRARNIPRYYFLTPNATPP